MNAEYPHVLKLSQCKAEWFVHRLRKDGLVPCPVLILSARWRGSGADRLQNGLMLIGHGGILVHEASEYTRPHVQFSASPTDGRGMRAVVYDRYGPPDVVSDEEVPMPSPGAEQVLIEVVATSVNLTDWEGLTGSPPYARNGGLRARLAGRSARTSPGRVAAVGSGVTRFRQGDEVYGDNLALMGGFAEYAVAPESALARKPAELTFAEVATLPQSGSIAVQGTADVRYRQRVLITGAGGGAGSLAAQLAKLSGELLTSSRLLDNSFAA